MEESILISVKKVLGPGVEGNDFDLDILIHLNSVLAIVTQLGIGPKNGIYVEDASTTWSDLLGDDSAYLSMVRSYVTAKVRLLFDPPVSSAVLQSLERTCSEFEWRANVAVENKELEEAATV